MNQAPDDFPPEFWQGIDEFNAGEFYACHDTLETIWIPAVGVEKNLYQGVIQIAVAIYHLGNHNWRGAVILMGEGLNRLRGYPDEFAGIDWGQFRSDIAELLETLQELGADRVTEFGFADQASEQTKIVRSRPIIQKVAQTL
jgi:uncharacterized protein